MPFYLRKQPIAGHWRAFRLQLALLCDLAHDGCAVHNWRISSELVFGVISGLTRGGDLPAAVNEACWVGLATSGGETIFRGIVGPGTSKTWTERRAVTLELGNPGVVTLAVDGRSRTGLGSQPVTLSLAPVQGTSG